MTRLSYKTLFTIVAVLSVLIVFLLKIRVNPSPVKAEWWNDAWTYRQAINISSHNVGETNVYIIASVNIGSTAKSQTDNGDFRFTDVAGNLLPYYISSGVGTTNITFHINLTSFPSGAQTIYAYYGNPSASDGFNAADFSTQAINYVIGGAAAEELGGGPVAWWKFDEGVGTSVFDSSGHNNTGVFGAGTSSPTWTVESQCVSGKCLQFSGNNNYFSVTNGYTNLLKNNSAHTVSFWLKGITFSNSPVIISANTVSNYFFLQTNNSGTQLLWGYGVGTSNYRTYTSNVSNGWHFISMVKTGSGNNGNLYVDGILQSSYTGSLGDLSNSVSDLLIGKYFSGGFGFNGFLDDIKIYPYARSAKQIQQDYATGISGQSTSHGSSVQIGSQSNKSLSDGLVGYWKFDEGVGTSSADSSGNNILATFATGNSAPSWSVGKYGVGLSFDGSNDYATATLSGLNSTAGGYNTVSFWMYWSGNNAKIPLAFSGQYDFYLWSQTCIGINTGNSDVYGFNPTSLALNNRWAHVVVLFYNGDPINNGQIYIDGVRQNLSQCSGTSISKTLTSNPTLYLGRYSSSANYFGGAIDDVRIYNRALSPTEVKALYNYAPGPVGYWKFDEGVGTTAYDSSGNGKNGFFWNPISWTTGKIGKAISLGTTQAYVDTNLYLNNNLNSYTLNAWIYPTANGSAFITNTSDSNYFNGNALSVSNNTTLSWALRYNSGVGTTVITATIPSGLFNKWSYITATANKNDATNTLYTLYVNGIAVTSATYSFTYPNPAARQYRFGVVYTDFSQYGPYSGKIDDVKIYNYARSQSQILEDMGASPPSKSPILWYKFDEGQGSSTANWGIGGTLTGVFGSGTSSPSWAIGKFNKALSFDGGTKYVGLSDDPKFDFGTNDFTVSAWALRNSNFGNYDSIITSKWNGGSFQGTNEWVLSSGACSASPSDTYPCFMIESGNTVFSAISPDTTANDAWYHYVGVRDGNYIRLYVNGMLKKSTLIGTSAVNNISGRTLKVGKIDASGYGLNGSIDEVKIYNYALSSDEVKTEYNQGAALVVGQSTQTIGATTTSLDYCIPGDTSPCSPPVAEWKFDEGVGTTAFDQSGGGNNLPLGPGDSAPTFNVGKINSGLLFSGNDYIGKQSYTLAGFTGPVTINTWVKTTSNIAGGIVSRYGNSGRWTYRLYMDNTGKIIFNRGNVTGGFNTTLTSTTAINNGQWHYLSARYDGSTMKIYIDGSENVSVGNTNTSEPPQGNFCIGTDYYDCHVVGTGYFNGSIDQVKIYNYARTPAQIAYDYNRGAPVGWWKMDECQGTTIADWSGNANHGTLNIGASGTQTTAGTCTTSSTAWGIGATGKINSSINFDGTDDSVTINNSPSLQISKAITISAWVKPSSTPGQYSRIVDKNRTTAYSFGIQTPGQALFTAKIGGSIQVPSSANTVIPTGTYSHIVATYDGSIIRYYFNGAPDGTAIPSPAGDISTSTDNLYIGSALASTYFPGQIDDVRIYNYALTSAQVKTLYNGGAVSFK